MRTCSLCGETKPIAEFYRYKNGYIRRQCKACHIATVRRSQGKFPDKIASANKRYRQSHREALRERDRLYRKQNRLKKALAQRRYYARHRDVVLARLKAMRAMQRQKRIDAGLPVRSRGRPRTIFE